MGRIFTFGCSFTNYGWPTWADIILYKNEGYNLGLVGGGYDSILYRIMEADRAFKFTSDDIAIVVLTTPIRWDLIIEDSVPIWKCFGQTTTSSLSKYNNKLYSIDGLLFKSFYNIILINDYLKKTNIRYLLGSVNNPYLEVENYFDEVNIHYKTTDLINYVKDNVELHLQDFYSFLHRKDNQKKWKVGKKFKDYNDYHPTPRDHFKWVNNVLLDKIDIQLNFTENMLVPLENEIESYKIHSELNNLCIKFPNLFWKRTDTKIYLMPDKKEKLKLI